MRSRVECGGNFYARGGDVFVHREVAEELRDGDGRNFPPKKVRIGPTGTFFCRKQAALQRPRPYPAGSDARRNDEGQKRADMMPIETTTTGNAWI